MRTLLQQGTLIGLHWLGAALLGLGLAYGNWAWRQMARRADDAPHCIHALLRLRWMYGLMVVPGSLLLLFSGLALVQHHRSWEWLLTQPWVVGMLGVTVVEFIEGLTVTRAHLQRNLSLACAGQPLRLAGRGAEAHHFDLPLYAGVLVLGLTRVQSWYVMLTILAAAMLVGAILADRSRRASAENPA
jgi:Predicted integral membrane protein (DUF2269)